MTKRLPVVSTPGSLEDYAIRFEELFGLAPSEGFHRYYLEGLLLPPEQQDAHRPRQRRALRGAQHKEAQRWDSDAINERRLGLRLDDPRTVLNTSGALATNETGDRKDPPRGAPGFKEALGKKEAHEGPHPLS